jgi:N-acetyl-gamma-glutamyl-phosphate reductase
VENKHGVAVLGATGYTGLELLRLLCVHPCVQLLGASSRQYAGVSVAEAVPFLGAVQGCFDADETSAEEWYARGVRTVFAAFPHGVFAARARGFLQAGMRVIDVSSDFRLKSAEDYVHFYGMQHPDAGLLKEAGYGLAEWDPEVPRACRLIANPGCYPTASLLALWPVLEAGMHSGACVVVNALSGVSGAGRAASVKNLFVEVEGSAYPYKLGQEHAHCGEIQQTMAQMCAIESPVPSLVFNPHVVPMARGIVATVTVPLKKAYLQEEVLQVYQDAYRASSFVRVLQGDRLPNTRDVRGTNRCDVGVRLVEKGTVLVVTSVIDNLMKGAAGQAVHNLNLAEGWDVGAGLPVCGV